MVNTSKSSLMQFEKSLLVVYAAHGCLTTEQHTLNSASDGQCAFCNKLQYL